MVEVGRALQEIKDDKLYKELGERLTFEQYCRSRWSIADRTERRDVADLAVLQHDGLAHCGRNARSGCFCRRDNRQVSHRR